jgi:hypothetical protein
VERTLGTGHAYSVVVIEGYCKIALSKGKLIIPIKNENIFANMHAIGNVKVRTIVWKSFELIADR